MFPSLAAALLALAASAPVSPPAAPAAAPPAPAPAPAPAPGAPIPDGAALTPEELARVVLTLSEAERRAAVRRLSREEVGEFVRRMPQKLLIELGRQVVGGLGVYSARFEKVERVDGELQEPATLSVVVRDRPFAILIDFVAGPKTGRRVLYDVKLRPGDLRAREPGLLGLAGGVWVGVESSLTRGDTNHPITHAGFTALLDLIERDVKLAAPHGGFAREELGYDDRGRWCMRYTAPPGSPELKARSTRMCVSAELGLPMLVEVHDAEGLLERYDYLDVRPRLTVPADFFTLEATGL